MDTREAVVSAVAKRVVALQQTRATTSAVDRGKKWAMAMQDPDFFEFVNRSTMLTSYVRAVFERGKAAAEARETDVADAEVEPGGVHAIMDEAVLVVVGAEADYDDYDIIITDENEDEDNEENDDDEDDYFLINEEDGVEDD